MSMTPLLGWIFYCKLDGWPTEIKRNIAFGTYRRHPLLTYPLGFIHNGVRAAPKL